MLAAGAASPAGRLRYKIRTYGLNISSSSHLIVANLTLLGQTFHAQGAVPKLLLESLQLRYPSFSRRSLGDYRVAASTVLSCAASPAPPPAPAAGNWSACVQAMGAAGCGAYRQKNAKHCEGCDRGTIRVSPPSRFHLYQPLPPTLFLLPPSLTPLFQTINAGHEI